jgi:hypothetical protein
VHFTTHSHWQIVAARENPICSRYLASHSDLARIQLGRQSQRETARTVPLEDSGSQPASSPTDRRPLGRGSRDSGKRYRIKTKCMRVPVPMVAFE